MENPISKLRQGSAVNSTERFQTRLEWRKGGGCHQCGGNHVARLCPNDSLPQWGSSRPAGSTGGGRNWADPPSTPRDPLPEPPRGDSSRPQRGTVLDSRSPMWGKCLACGVEGHMSKDCPHRGWMRCIHCKERGISIWDRSTHHSDFCRYGGFTPQKG